MSINYKFFLLAFCSLAVLVVVFQSVEDLTQSYMNEEQASALASQSKSNI